MEISHTNNYSKNKFTTNQFLPFLILLDHQIDRVLQARIEIETEILFAIRADLVNDTTKLLI